MTREYDMAVIGGGAAGLTAAGMAGVLGAKTALVEEKKLGGDCTWYGCVPSKSLLRAAKVSHHIRTAHEYGLEACGAEADLLQVMSRVRRIREQIYEDADAPVHFERLGVEVISGRAHFLDPHTIEITGNGEARRLSSRFFVIATGSSPRVAEISGASPGLALTNETVFDLDRLPKHLLVMGAGPIGIEMAQAFRRLGSAVTVIERSPGILDRDDRELTAILLQHLRNEGISILTGDEMERFQDGAAYTREGVRLEVDAILAAIGRRPNIKSLDLGAAGVQSSDKGIIVDRRCRSSARHIYACGDVAGRFLFTHMAEHMAKTAVTNAILRLPVGVDESHVTWCTYTDPELAQAGATEQDLKSRGVSHSVYRFPFSQLDRAITESETTGMVKVMANRWGRILGASILGANAGEMIAEYALAMRNGVRLDQVSSTIHPYPTYALGNRRAADLFLMGKLSPGMVRWFRRLFRLRGSLRGAMALQRSSK